MSDWRLDEPEERRWSRGFRTSNADRWLAIHCWDCRRLSHRLTPHNGRKLCCKCLQKQPDVQQQIEADRHADDLATVND